MHYDVLNVCPSNVQGFFFAFLYICIFGICQVIDFPCQKSIILLFPLLADILTQICSVDRVVLAFSVRCWLIPI